MKASIIAALFAGLPLTLAYPTKAEDALDFGLFYDPAYNHNWEISELQTGRTNVFSISFAIKDLNNSASAVHCGQYGRTQPKDMYSSCSNGAFVYAYSSANPDSLDPDSFILNLQQLDFSNPTFAVVKSGNFTINNSVPGFTCSTTNSSQGAATSCNTTQTATVPYNIVPYYMNYVTPAPAPKASTTQSIGAAPVAPTYSSSPAPPPPVVTDSQNIN